MDASVAGRGQADRCHLPAPALYGDDRHAGRAATLFPRVTVNEPDPIGNVTPLRARYEISGPDPIALPEAWEGWCSSSRRERHRVVGGRPPRRRDSPRGPRGSESGRAAPARGGPWWSWL